MAAGGVAGGVGNSAPPAAAPAPVAQFEAARAAADQRAAKSMAALDAVTVTSAGSGERQVSGHTFRLDGDVWTDIRPAGNTREVTVKAYSKAYFDLLQQIPELAKMAGVGEQVTVVGRGLVISIRTTMGVESLTSAELSRIGSDW